MDSTAAAAVPCGSVCFARSTTAHPSTALTSPVVHSQHAQGPPQGMCFSLPSSSPADSSSETSSAGGSTCQHSPYSSVQSLGHDPAHPAGQQANSRSAGLLCCSPCISTGPEHQHHSAGQPSSAQHMSHPACKRHCQHMQDSDRAGSGMQNHQLNVSCRHRFSLPSLHSMLGGGAAASKSPGGATAAPTGDRPSTASMMPQGQGSTMQDCPADACSCEQQPAAYKGSLWSNGWSPAAAPARTRTASAAADAVCGAAGEAGQSMRQLAQVFMQACASPGAVAALAVLDHNNLLPVLPVEDLSASDDSSDDAPEVCGCLCATLGYMFVLAKRGGVMGMLTGGSDAETDTIIRTLLWMTESFFSQYRSHCKTAAYDYCMYTSGLELEDPMVQDALGEEVPAMIALQRHILASSCFRLMVTEQQLQYACSTLQEASTDSCSIQSIQSKVDLVVVEYEEWRLAALDTLRGQQQQQPKVEQKQPPKQQQQREALQDVTNVNSAGNRQALLAAVAAAYAHAELPVGPDPQLAGASSLPPTCAPLSNAPKAQPQKQQQQQGPQTRQQYRMGGSRQSARTNSSSENTAPSGSAVDCGVIGDQSARPAASKKDQLLHLTTRERAVGNKRKRSAAGTAAAAGPARQPQQQGQGHEAGFGAGGKRLLRQAVRAAQSAVQYLGCRPQ